MPLYDLQCKKCGEVEEKLFTTWLNFISEEELTRKEKKEIEELSTKKFAGYDIIHTRIVRYTHQICSCGGFQELVAPLTNMQPDNMWAGQNTKFGYFTSKSQYEQSLKDRNLVTIDKKELDNTRKKVYNTRQDNKRKQAEATNDFLAQQLASVEISPDGNTVKERNKYARKRQ